MLGRRGLGHRRDAVGVGVKVNMDGHGGLLLRKSDPSH